MNKKLNGKTVLITGASSGLGEQLALKCAENGANLVLIARSIDKLKRLKDKICEHTSVNVSIYQLDIGDLSQIEFVFKTIFQETESIDVLINNAGFGVFKYVVDATITEAEKCFKSMFLA